MVQSEYMLEQIPWKPDMERIEVHKAAFEFD